MQQLFSYCYDNRYCSEWKSALDQASDSQT
jgi:hypothetical protein